MGGENGPASRGDILPYTARETTLANGLRVIVVPTGFPNLVSLQIPVQTGSRNEVEPGKSGFAHFFEHMMFRGTEHYPAHRYQEVVTRAGARQNAYTTDDYTNYHMTFAREDLETILEIEADRFMNLSYSEEDFKTEARAVLGEYNKNSADPLNKLIEVQREHAFSTHTYRHTTMGFLADIEDMPNQFAYSRLFFKRWYRPEYTTVLVAGDVDPDEVVTIVERHWGGWERGSHTVEIPAEPVPGAPVVAHVPWATETLPWVTVGFHGPAFSETEKDFAALDVLFDLHFGETSDLYRRLVEQEQKCDQLFPYMPPTADPGLPTVMARVKDLADAQYVRDAIIETIAAAKRRPVPAARLEEAKSHNRYAFARTLDNSESIAAALASFVRFQRSYQTLNNLFRVYDSLTVEDLTATAKRYLTGERQVITTLCQGGAPAELAAAPRLAEPPPAAVAPLAVVRLPSPSPLLRFKLLFNAGSAYDPPGKEGLAALSASMIADAGSRDLRIDEINKALFPMAGSFRTQVDREMSTFTGVVHRDNLGRFAEIVLKQLVEPGMREEDFSRLKAIQLNELVQDLRANNEEELGKERLQEIIFAGTPYRHPVAGTVAGIQALTMDDVREFMAAHFTRANLTIGVAGDFPEAFASRLQEDLAVLPAGAVPAPPIVSGRQPSGIEVEIIEKDTRATAISFGHPIGVTRSHPDFAALWLARAWLGEHRASHGRLFQRIREVRGMNYGNYAYIEAFPRGMFQFFPDPNLARRAQIFEVWIRPVMPESAVFAFKTALFELTQLIEKGIDGQEFDTIRNYLLKNVYVMLKTQDQQLGYALDSGWYGMGEFAAAMRDRLAALTPAAVHDAIQRHLSSTNLSAVFIAGDARGLRGQLLSGEPSAIAYDAAKPPEVLAEDRVIGALDLGVRAEAIRITPVEDVFAR